MEMNDWIERAVEWLTDIDGHEEGAEMYRNVITQCAPGWHDKPTCPGWWISINRKNGKHEWGEFESQEEIDEYPMKERFLWFGPIPERPQP